MNDLQLLVFFFKEIIACCSILYNLVRQLSIIYREREIEKIKYGLRTLRREPLQRRGIVAELVPGSGRVFLWWLAAGARSDRPGHVPRGC